MNAGRTEALAEVTKKTKGDELTGSEPALASGDDDVIFVHRCSGKIDEIRPATGVRLTTTAIVVLYGDTPVAAYKRSDVYFAAKCEIPPPVMC